MAGPGSANADLAATLTRPPRLETGREEDGCHCARPARRMSQSDQQRHPARDGAGAPGGASQGQSPARGAPDAVPRSGAALMSRSRWTWCSATVPRDRGATSDLISTDPEVGAGVAFVRLEADPDPVRVRAA